MYWVWRKCFGRVGRLSNEQRCYPLFFEDHSCSSNYFDLISLSEFRAGIDWSWCSGDHRSSRSVMISMTTFQGRCCHSSCLGCRYCHSWSGWGIWIKDSTNQPGMSQAVNCQPIDKPQTVQTPVELREEHFISGNYFDSTVLQQHGKTEATTCSKCH